MDNDIFFLGVWVIYEYIVMFVVVMCLLIKKVFIVFFRWVFMFVSNVLLVVSIVGIWIVVLNMYFNCVVVGFLVSLFVEIDS